MNSRKAETIDVTLRCTVTVRDIPGIQRILEHTEAFKPHEITVALELTEEWITKGDGSGYHFIIAEHHGEIAGYVCYGPITMTTRRFDIYWLAVDPSFQGKGIGSVLITEAEHTMADRGCRSVFLDTSSKDAYKKARNFYRKQGYQEVARIPGYYDDNDDKVILMKHILPLHHSEHEPIF